MLVYHTCTECINESCTDDSKNINDIPGDGQFDERMVLHASILKPALQIMEKLTRLSRL